MKAKPFILLISSSMFAAQSLAICSKVPEAYAETAYHFVTTTTNGTQTIAAGGSYIWQSTSSVVDETGYENSETISTLPIPWKTGFDPKHDTVTNSTLQNSGSQPWVVGWSLEAGSGHNRFIGNTSGKLYGRGKSKWQYNVVQNPD